MFVKLKKSFSFWILKIIFTCSGNSSFIPNHFLNHICHRCLLGSCRLHLALHLWHRDHASWELHLWSVAQHWRLSLECDILHQVQASGWLLQITHWQEDVEENQQCFLDHWSHRSSWSQASKIKKIIFLIVLISVWWLIFKKPRWDQFIWLEHSVVLVEEQFTSGFRWWRWEDTMTLASIVSGLPHQIHSTQVIPKIYKDTENDPGDHRHCVSDPGLSLCSHRFLSPAQFRVSHRNSWDFIIFILLFVGMTWLMIITSLIGTKVKIKLLLK